MLACGGEGWGRGYGDGSTPYDWLSSIALLPWLRSFPPQAFSAHFPPQSPPSQCLHPSLCSKQQSSPWDCSTILKLQLPATVPFRESVALSVARTVWSSFYSGCHRSVVSLSALNVSPLTQTIAPMWRLDPCFISPTGPGQIQSYYHSCFSPCSFILPSFAWFYIFFPSSQVLLSTLSWCSACTSVSGGVFLMYSMERDVLHVHLLLCHLVLEFFFN